MLTVLLAAVLSAGGLSAARPVPAPQSGDWHVSLLASFDDVWQTVHDTYYDPAFGGVDWDAVRRELRPAVEHAASPAAARQVIAEMIARLGQSHFVILSSVAGPADSDTLPGEATVPVEIRIVDGTAVITAIDGDAFVTRAGVQPGQTLVDIDGHDTAALIAAANTLLAKYADEPEPPPQVARPESAEPAASVQPPRVKAEAPELPKTDNPVAKPAAKSAPQSTPKSAPLKELDIPL